MGNNTDIQEVKARADIVQVVSRYVNLKKSSANFVGLCPFHGEKTPSFNVNPALGIYKCFGCGVTGDVIKFIQEIEHIEFPQALEKLADEFGVKLHKADDPNVKLVGKLREINKLAAEFFHYMLTKHPSGVDCLEYTLKKRRLSKETIVANKIGFAPKDSFVLQNFLKKKGFTLQEIHDAGLINEKGYDKYTDRLMFPVFDLSGHVVAFSGRVYRKEDERPKYLNSPETLVFKKRFTLFGLYGAKDQIAKQNIAILCEGQIDAIVSQQVGVKHTATPLGTGLTDTQLSILSRFTKNVAFCFDNDAAGQKSIMRGVQLALAQDMRPFLILLPEDVKDIDDLVQKRPDDWIDRATHPLDFFEYQITQLKQLIKKDMATFEKRLQEVLAVAGAATELKQGIIAKQFAESLGLGEQGLLAAMRKSAPVSLIRDEMKQKQGALTTAEYVLSVVIAFPLVTLVMGNIEKVSLYFVTADQQQLFRKLYEFAKLHENIVTSVQDKKTKELQVSWEIVYGRFLNELMADYSLYLGKIQEEEPSLATLLERVGLAEQTSNISITDEIVTDFFQAWIRLQRQMVNARLEMLRKKLGAAELSQDEKTIEQLQAETIELMILLRKIEKKTK